MKKMFGFYAVLAFAVFVSFVFGLEVTKQDSKFMMQAAQSDMAEIMMGNMALQKSQNAEVRRFAQMMVDDHTRTSEQMKTMAASKNVTLPADMDAKQKAMSDKLMAMSGDKFDMEYMKGQVKMHEAAVKLFQSESSKGTDADIKGFATATLPALEGHLSMARSMSGNMKGGGNSNRSSMSSDNMNDMNMNSNSNSNSNRGNTNSNSNRNRNSNSNGNSNSNSNRR